MTRESERLRLIEIAPEWSHEVFDICAEPPELLESHSHRFSGTTPGARHSYTFKSTWPGEHEFLEALRKMRAVERIEEFFKGYWYRLFNANGYKYWTMRRTSITSSSTGRSMRPLSIPMQPFAIPKIS